MKNRESAYTRETSRVTLLVVDEPHAGGRVSLSLPLSLSVSLTLSRYFYYSLLLLMMMMREGESNDDAAPGGRGTQHNKTQ